MTLIRLYLGALPTTPFEEKKGRGTLTSFPVTEREVEITRGSPGFLSPVALPLAIIV